MWNHIQTIPWCMIQTDIDNITTEINLVEERLVRLQELRRMVKYGKARFLVIHRGEAFDVIKGGILKALADRGVSSLSPRGKI